MTWPDPKEQDTYDHLLCLRGEARYLSRELTDFISDLDFAINLGEGSIGPITKEIRARMGDVEALVDTVMVELSRRITLKFEEGKVSNGPD